MVRIKEVPQDCQSLEDWQSYISLQFRNLFSTYTKAINKSYQRTGSLFEKPFKRRLVSEDAYFRALILYIHQNPQKHGFVDDFRDWPFSSYQVLTSDQPIRLQRQDVIRWFGNADGFRKSHQPLVDETNISNLVSEDFD